MNPAKVFCFATVVVATVLKSCLDPNVLAGWMTGLLDELAVVRISFLFWMDLLVGRGTDCLSLLSS